MAKPPDIALTCAFMFGVSFGLRYSLLPASDATKVEDKFEKKSSSNKTPTKNRSEVAARVRISYFKESVKV